MSPSMCQCQSGAPSSVGCTSDTTSAAAAFMPRYALTLFIYGVIPFNVVKGLALSLVTFLLYKPLSPLLHDR